MTEKLDLITVDPRVLRGRPHVRGTRIPVSLVLGCLAEGMTEGEILVEYPTLTVAGVRAAAAYGAAPADQQTILLG